MGSGSDRLKYCALDRKRRLSMGSVQIRPTRDKPELVVGLANLGRAHAYFPQTPILLAYTKLPKQGVKYILSPNMPSYSPDTSKRQSQIFPPKLGKVRLRRPPKIFGCLM